MALGLAREWIEIQLRYQRPKYKCCVCEVVRAGLVLFRLLGVNLP